MRTYLVIILFVIAKVELDIAKKFEICELVDELHNKYNVPRDEIYEHLCIVCDSDTYELDDEHYKKTGYKIYKRMCISKELNKTTTSYGPFGIFKISVWWCAEHDEDIGICNASCDDFVDDDIADDVECATLVLQHDGIDAWLLSDRNCEGYKKEVDTCLERVKETSKSFGDSYDIDEYGDFMNHTDYASSAVATTNSFLGTHFTILSFALFFYIKIF